MTLGIASMAAMAANALSGIVVGRVLGPDAFGEAALVATVSLILGGAASYAQLLTVTTMCSQVGRDGVVRVCPPGVGTRTRLVGWLVAAVLLAASPVLHAWTQTSSLWTWWVLAAAAPLHLELGRRRGACQAGRAFRRLATVLAVEGAVRLVVTVGLLVAGVGVEAAVIGLVASLAAAVIAAGPPVLGASGAAISPVASVRHRPDLATMLVAQAVIVNGDVAVVAAVAPAASAAYAAMALVGRMVMLGSTAIATVALPAVSARRAPTAGPGTDPLRRAVVLAAWCAGAGAVGCAALGPTAVRLTLGADLEVSPWWCGLYALATGLAGIAHVAISRDIADGGRRGAVVVAVGAAVQTAAIAAVAAQGIWAAVVAQVVCMAAMAVALVHRSPAHTRRPFGRLIPRRSELCPARLPY